MRFLGPNLIKRPEVGKPFPLQGETGNQEQLLSLKA